MPVPELDYRLPMCSESSWLFGFTDSREEDAMAGMQWCEQWWALLPELTDSWCCLDRDKAVFFFTVTWLHSGSLQHHGSGPNTPEPKKRQHKCWLAFSSSFICYSGYAISSKGQVFIRSVAHQRSPITTALCRDAFQENFSQACWSCSQQLLRFSYPSVS